MNSFNTPDSLENSKTLVCLSLHSFKMHEKWRLFQCEILNSRRNISSLLFIDEYMYFNYMGIVLCRLIQTLQLELNGWAIRENLGMTLKKGF